MALEVRNVGKRYGSVQALADVSATFRAGSIHAVLGENGAGKSTLMGVLSGFVRPDSGVATLDGEPIPTGRPFDCKRFGIELVHQHFTLVPNFTVAENLALARVERLGQAFLAGDCAEPALSLARQLGWEIPGAARVRDLPVGVQQRVEILKTLVGDARVLIFDEPTAVLGADEVEDLFRVLRQLRDRGKVILLIAHKLAEVMAVADEVTVLRRGRKVAESSVAKTHPRQLAEWMVGEVPAVADSATPPPMGPGLTVRGLWVRGDRGEEAVRGLDFEIARGEILGFGGVDGNGQVELAEALARVRPFLGEATFHEEDEPTIAYIPQDRQQDGLALGMSIRDNLLITGHRDPELSKGPVLRSRRVAEWCQGLVERFRIKVGRVSDPASALSGGNQQKVVVSRALARVPDLLIAVNPTRGLDLQATDFVHRQIRAARDAGAAVALISTDLDELAALAGRTVFLGRGELKGGDLADALAGGKA